MSEDIDWLEEEKPDLDHLKEVVPLERDFDNDNVSNIEDCIMWDRDFQDSPSPYDLLYPNEEKTEEDRFVQAVEYEKRNGESPETLKKKREMLREQRKLTEEEKKLEKLKRLRGVKKRKDLSDLFEEEEVKGESPLDAL